MGKNKLLLIGWDGATFDIIKPLVEKGDMPNMASLMKNGVWGRLESTVPPLTPVAWTSISTGVNPGKHGIYDIMMYSREEHKVKFFSAAVRKVRPLWSILSASGRSVGVMNVPMTYPPDEVNGFMISGMLTPYGVSDFIHPQGLKAEIEKRFGKYMIECNQTDNPSKYLGLILDMVDLRGKVALYLMESSPWDFFFTVFIASDRVQHFFWKYLNPNHPEHHKYGRAIAEVYRRMDNVLGKLVEKSGPDTYVMMVSDHGSGPLDTAFFLNNWLIKNGYLYLKDDLANALKIKKPSPIKMGIAKSVKMLLPTSVAEKIKKGPDRHEELNTFSNFIDWDRTTAFSIGVSGTGGIYINHDLIGNDKVMEIVGRIKKDLMAIKDPLGRNVIKDVYHRDEIYSGEYVKMSPDMIIICSPGYQVIAPNEFLNPFFKKGFEDSLFVSPRWSGRHEQYGIFLLKGNGVRKNTEIESARVIDIAPMSLYLMGEDIPDYMDGRVIENAIENDYFNRNTIRYAGNMISHRNAGKELTEDQEKEIAERLRGLGYIE